MRRVGLFLAIATLGIVAALVGIRSTEPPKRATVGAEETARPEARPGADVAAGGTVLDAETGEPVPGARLTLYRAPLDLPAAQVVATLVADDHGRFSVADHDEVNLVVEAEGYPPQASWFDPAGMEIRLSVGQDRTMRIVDDEQRPAAGAEVDVFADGSMRIRLTSAEADAGGVVTLRLTGGETLLVRLEGYAYELRGSEATDVTLVPEYTIGGRIEDSAGRPIPGASVRLRQGTGCETWSEYAPVALSGRDGRFLFRGVHGCECELKVRAEGYCEALFHASPGDEDRRVVLRRAASASGVVVMPDGSPAVLAIVNLDGREDRGVGTSEEGRFTLTGLEPRAQEIQVAKDDLRAAVEIAPTEGEAITGLRVELGAPGKASSFLRVQVLDGQGRPVPGASVVAHNGRGSTVRITGRYHNTGYGSGSASRPVLGPDGRTLVFQSFAGDFVQNDFNDTRDLFLLKLGEGDADNDGMSDSWEQTHFSTTDRDGTGDFDQDGSTDLAEYLTGTNPVDGQSVFEVLQITSVGTNERQLIWSAEPGKSYRLEYKFDLSGATWTSLGQVITATSTTASALDTAATTEKRFYRVALVQ